MRRFLIAVAAGLCLVTTAEARPHRAHPIHYNVPINTGLPYSGPAELVARARYYLGTNPTGWRRVWCGRFMAMIAPRAARRIGNPNLAKNWARLPRVSPHVGAIAVLRRAGGGHVGVVAGFRGRDPILISGNHGHRVGIGVYPAHRVIAYVKG